MAFIGEPLAAYRRLEGVQVGYGILNPRVERYSEGSDILLMLEGSDLVNKRPWLDLAPSRLSGLILFLFDPVDLLKEESDGWVGGWQIVAEVLL